MARPLDLERRRILLAGAFAHISDHGLAKVSLRPLARALGTSDRMLLHHFGSKDQLLTQVLEAARPDPMPDSGPGVDAIRADLVTLWQEVVDNGPQAARLRLFFEASSLGMFGAGSYTDFAAAAIRSWQAHLTGRLTDAGVAHPARTAAALIAAFRGSALERFVTGEVDMPTAALHLVLDALLIDGRHRVGVAIAGQ